MKTKLILIAIVAVIALPYCLCAQDGVSTEQPQVVISSETPAAAGAPVAAAAAPLFPVKRDINLSVNYPGVAVRYFVADGKALELLGQSQDKVFVGGLRYYYYPARLRSGALSPYLAVEGDYLSFKGDYSKGKGWGGGLYAGAEYRLGRRFSVQTDMGAMYVSISDKSTDLTESGLEFLLNLGFNVYFGGAKP